MNLHGMLRTFDWFVLWYVVVLNSSYLVLVVVAVGDVVHLLRRTTFIGYEDIFANPLTPPVSVIVPAHNEEAVIVESVRAMLALRYPEFEIIVVEDGSTDDTFARLDEAFGLHPVERALPGQVPTIGAVTAVYASDHGDPLVVVRKACSGRRSDAMNVGIDLARYPLLCMVDADSILEESALLRVAKPFVDDPERVIATGGVIRAANGSTVYRGRVEDPRLSSRWLARIQTVEYIRAFLLGRIGWSRLHALLIISGAFGLFRRDLVIEVGGLDLDSLGEDAELVARLHAHLREQRRDYRIVFVPEPVCWTEVPETVTVLARQRRRWSRGLAQLVRKHRRMVGNPRYGRIGLVTLPYYIGFELLGPVVEVVGLVMIAIGLWTGAVGGWFAVAFTATTVLYGLFVTACALAIEEFSFHRYPRWLDLQRSFVAALLENLGYRQLHSWWRLQGLLDEVFQRQGSWGDMTRRGFDRGGESVPPDTGETATAAARVNA